MQHTKENILINGICIYIFLLWFFPLFFALTTALLLIIDIVYLLTTKNIKFKFTNSTKLWYLFIFIQLVSLISTSLTDINNLIDGFQFLIYQVIFLFNYLLLLSIEDWTDKFIKKFAVVLGIFFAGSLLQLINADLLTSINTLHFNSDIMYYYYSFLNSGNLVGFTYQTTVNGYILSLLQGIFLIYVFKSEKIFKKTIWLFLFLINFYFIFLTGKRALIIFSMVIMLAVSFAFMKRKVNIIFMIVLIVLLGWYFLYNTDAGALIIERMKMLETSNNITAGRSLYNNIMWKDFLNKQMVGFGTYSTRTIIDATNGHNIYLQVLRENGILGFVPFMLILVTNFLKGYKVLLTTNNKNIYKYHIGISVYFQMLFILWGATENPLYDVFPLVIYFCSLAILDSTLNSMKILSNDNNL